MRWHPPSDVSSRDVGKVRTAMDVGCTHFAFTSEIIYCSSVQMSGSSVAREYCKNMSQDMAVDLDRRFMVSTVSRTVFAWLVTSPSPESPSYSSRLASIMRLRRLASKRSFGDGAITGSSTCIVLEYADAKQLHKLI